MIKAVVLLTIYTQKTSSPPSAKLQPFPGERTLIPSMLNIQIIQVGRLGNWRTRHDLICDGIINNMRWQWGRQRVSRNFVHLSRMSRDPCVAHKCAMSAIFRCKSVTSTMITLTRFHRSHLRHLSSIPSSTYPFYKSFVSFPTNILMRSLVYQCKICKRKTQETRRHCRLDVGRLSTDRTRLRDKNLMRPDSPRLRCTIPGNTAWVQYTDPR